MNDKDFFRYYIPALEKSISLENNEDYSVNGPDWFIENNELRDELDAFEIANYNRFKVLFDMVACFLDARAHNFDTIEDISLPEFKQKLELEILAYKKRFLE